ncbi:hypothetical protein B0J11DRAFT_549473 [Dendryphion nanum]|uniref:F-box domain-containing protein n=1 Tax=Dendryphion nanum TaxID=256645 RepID=A0A9P9IN94_9PLEO|nr:hypothetical protein B0J11DRAFT_549473 [Dendryphion nanum]
MDPSPVIHSEKESSPPVILPSLPPEIWIRILSHHEDPVHLWTTCRRVSNTFLSYVDQVFADSYLRYSFAIDFQLEKHNLGGKSQRPEIPCTFHHFSLDKQKHLAHFRDPRPKKGVIGPGPTPKHSKDKSNATITEYDRVIERWTERIATSKPETPHYTIRLLAHHRTTILVNDTALPDLHFNASMREISFDWRSALTLFFREQARLLYLKAQHTTSSADILASNRALLASQKPIDPSSLPLPWPSLEPSLRKQIRRTRLRETYAGNEEMMWALKSLGLYEGSKAADGRVLKSLGEIPGAGLGEKWWGSTWLLQGLYLDEWAALQGMERKVEGLREGWGDAEERAWVERSKKVGRRRGGG